MKSAETKFRDSRPDILLRALYYHLIPEDTIQRYEPHFLMFGRIHVETVLKREDNQWQIFNRTNFSSLYKEANKKLNKYSFNDIDPTEIYEMIYPNRGHYSNLVDPIPKQLFYLGMTESTDTSFKHDLSVVIYHSLPHWIHFYSNLQLFRYQSGFERVSLIKVREVEGYEPFTYLLDNEDKDYSLYNR